MIRGLTLYMIYIYIYIYILCGGYHIYIYICIYIYIARSLSLSLSLYLYMHTRILWVLAVSRVGCLSGGVHRDGFSVETLSGSGRFKIFKEKLFLRFRMFSGMLPVTIFLWFKIWIRFGYDFDTSSMRFRNDVDTISSVSSLLQDWC